ncbi:MAG: adenylate/guanylate cyclase domain-containing protein [Planctomycetes bacterium]|nr:adenylate/guanylate cyclase domain-containing protein [Planctomycetota bacterium]
MPDLIAQGPNASDRWRRPLPRGGEPTGFMLGRVAPGWAVPWDDRISRQHADLRWDGEKLAVQRMPDAKNPIFYRGLRKDEFEIGVGDHFVIGQTTFSLVDQRVRILASNDEPPTLTEQSYSNSQLRRVRYRDATQRIDTLSRLPEIISSSSSDEELHVRVVNLLMQGIPRATFVAIVSEQASTSTPPTKTRIEYTPNPSGWSETSDSGIRVLHWDSRQLILKPFSPSAQLIRQALSSNESILHVWSRAAGNNTPSVYTQSENVDWAFCTPISGEACPGWAIYVAGDLSSMTAPGNRDATLAATDDLQDDLKFAELTATTMAMLRQTRLLQRRQDSLRPFFSPIVRHALATRDPDQVLAPREVQVSVMFCDLRGFSRQSEDSSDQLLELLRRVSDALGVMTHHILNRNGVVGDFHGDAAMGFWGWPLEQTDSVRHAAAAALAIRAEFEKSAALSDHPLSGFRAGIGLCTGRAVAGRIGTVDQVKVTVFGPVVNLAARLESMTKQLQASILIDETTAQRIKAEVPTEIARVRRVAKVLPLGMKKPLMVSELLPPESPDFLLTNQHVQAYEKALDSFQDGNWGEAFRLLHQVPAEDRVKDFLTVLIAQHGRTAPPDWSGYIKLAEK